jgi:(p)ppGpp synthase/HD superfamily hydrolase
VQKHGSHKRASGDPYFSHPVEVAGLMTDWKLDRETIITALLHDTVEDTLATIADVEKNFSPEVARLADGVTKFSRLESMPENERAMDIYAPLAERVGMYEYMRAPGVLHRTWQFLPGRFKHYISTPKTNGYRSLHTTLIYESSMRVEVQIRSRGQ